MFRIFSIILAYLMLALPAFAANSDAVRYEHIEARIIDENGKFGVELTPDSGWHFYYKEAGDAGYATEFDFGQPAKVTFPPYVVIDEYGFKVNAYTTKTFFPVELENKESINLKITGAVCKEICIPFEIEIEQNNHALSLKILAIALLAGLILNIMPCVLPVLSLKVLSLIKHTSTRKDFAETAAGIIFSFIVIAAGTIGFKQAGSQIGWGLQFQSAYFVGFLACVTFAFALSLFGLFHLKPPSWAGSIGRSNFAAGALATLLGTACTAPVLVTAVGFALSGSNTTILAIFTLMGIGMATPYLLFAACPALAKYLPKPGKWMQLVKYILGAMLLATSIWLVSVMFDKPSNEWQEFDESKISTTQVTFVDITAAWCINCKANKLAVLDTPEIKEFFSQNNVLLLRGDMTRPNPKLLTYIKKFDRYGIPVNVVYGPNAPNGIILPTILTKDAVKEAVLQAK